MKEFFKLVGILTVICAAAGLLLAVVQRATKEPIEAAGRAERLDAIKRVLPPYDNEPDRNSVTVEGPHGNPWTFYVARRDGAFAGAAFETVSSQGYGGDIVVMVGVSADDQVHAIEILKAKETPGLGAKIADPEFKSQFAGRDIQTTTWAVKKDQGDIDQITAATISSRAVVSAVEKALKVYQENKGRIQGS